MLVLVGFRGSAGGWATAWVARPASAAAGKLSRGLLDCSAADKLPISCLLRVVSTAGVYGHLPYLRSLTSANAELYPSRVMHVSFDTPLPTACYRRLQLP